MVSGPTGYKPCYEEWQRGGAARPRRVVESHPQNQDPSGASREGCQPPQSALCNTDQVFSTGTTRWLSIDSVKGVSLRAKCQWLLKWRL